MSNNYKYSCPDCGHKFRTRQKVVIHLRDKACKGEKK